LKISLKRLEERREGWLDDKRWLRGSTPWFKSVTTGELGPYARPTTPNLSAKGERKKQAEKTLKKKGGTKKG